MTVSNTTVKLTYAGNGSNRVFGITFPLLSASHLRVVVTDPDGVETTINGNYTLNTALNVLTYPTLVSGLDPLATGYTITLVRQTPLTQEIDLHSGHALDAEELERGYDKLTYAVQEIKEEVGRAVKTGVSESAPATAEAYMDAITAAKEAAETAATSAAGSASEAVIAQTTAAASATQAAASASDASDSADTATSAAVTAQSAEEGAQVAQAAAETAAASIATAISEHNQSASAHADLLATKQPKTLDTAITVAGESKTTVEAALGAINTLAAGKAAVSHTHTKADITDLPTIPTKTSDLQNDSGYITGVAWDDVSNKPSTFAPAAHTHTKSQVTDMPTKLSDFTDDLGSSPTHTHSQYLTAVPVANANTVGGIKPDGTSIVVAADGTASATGNITVDSALSDSSENPVQNKVIKAALDGKQKTLIAGTNITIAADGTISATGGGGGGSVDIDGSLSPTSNNPVANSAIYAALQDKQDTLTTAQQNAADSGITAAKVSSYDTHVANGDIHVTAAQKSTWSGKQDALTTAQQNAANSGVTADKVSGYDTHVANGDIHVTAAQKTAWNAKQDSISDLATIRTNAQAGSGAATTIAGYGDIVTHDADEFQAAGNYAAASHTHTKSQVTDMPTKLSDFTDDLGSTPTHTHSQYLTAVPVATTSTLGGVKPDGTTITAAADGTISAVGGGSSSALTATYDSTNKVLTLR